MQPKGYTKLAYLLGKYPEATVLQRFGHLDAINLLSLQAKLVALNREYEGKWQGDDASSDANISQYSTNFEKVHSTNRRPDGRLANLEEIKHIMKEYCKSHSSRAEPLTLEIVQLPDEALVLSTLITQLPRPDNPRIRFLNAWLSGLEEGKNSLQDEEGLIYHANFRDDFVALTDSTSWINPRVLDFLHGLGAKRDGNPAKMFDVELGAVTDFDSTRSARTGKLIWQMAIVLLASMMCVIAALILYYLKHTIRRIGFAIGSTALVGLFLFCFHRCQREGGIRSRRSMSDCQAILRSSLTTHQVHGRRCRFHRNCQR